MKNLISIAALTLALFAPVSFAVPAMAEGTPFCHSKALNGDTIDPPICNDARAVGAGIGSTDPMPSKVCTKTDESKCTY